MNKSRKPKPVVVATQGVTIRDFIVFQVKLGLEGARDFLAMNLSLIALVIDLFSGRGRRPRRFYTVVRWSRRFDGWLRLHSLKGLREMEEQVEPGRPPVLGSGTEMEEDAMPYGSDGQPTSRGGQRRLGSDADTLVEEIERLVRKGSMR